MLNPLSDGRCTLSSLWDDRSSTESLRFWCLVYTNLFESSIEVGIWTNFETIGHYWRRFGETNDSLNFGTTGHYWKRLGETNENTSNIETTLQLQIINILNSTTVTDDDWKTFCDCALIINYNPLQMLNASLLWVPTVVVKAMMALF